ncbi:hypothetical protein J8I87_36505 [Paraburkholderia sp. LEh10]|nr:hypothetical protein [Paraburkholderia sp. LEh10]
MNLGDELRDLGRAGDYIAGRKPRSILVINAFKHDKYRNAMRQAVVGETAKPLQPVLLCLNQFDAATDTRMAKPDRFSRSRVSARGGVLAARTPFFTEPSASSSSNPSS